jgi:hypothetical protein
MYKNGACDPECNNWECGHDGGDCNQEEAITQCTIGHNDKSLKSKPAQVTGSTVMGSNDTSKLADVELVVLSADPSASNPPSPAPAEPRPPPSPAPAEPRPRPSRKDDRVPSLL